MSNKFKKGSHFCATPKIFGRKAGQQWKCPKCGARYKFVVPKSGDPLGRTLRGYWLQVGDGFK